MAEKMKIYSFGDGRTLFAIAAPSRKLAAAGFTEAGIRVTVYQMTQFGYAWDFGQVDGTETIEKLPGVVFEGTYNMCASDKWSVSERYQTPSGRAALQKDTTHG